MQRSQGEKRLWSQNSKLQKLIGEQWRSGFRAAREELRAELGKWKWHRPDT
jgi:hypothetical protein